MFFHARYNLWLRRTIRKRPDDFTIVSLVVPFANLNEAEKIKRTGKNKINFKDIGFIFLNKKGSKYPYQFTRASIKWMPFTFTKLNYKLKFLVL